MNELDRLAQLVATHASGLLLYARQWLDQPSAEDTVQEALIALLGQKPPPDDPLAWMYRAVRNAAIDHARSASRRRRREQSVARDRREWFEARPDSLIDAQSAQQTLNQLPPEFRQVVILRIWGELGFAQIAQVMDLSVSTVHDRYVWALDQMRSTLEKSCRSKMD